MAKTLQNFQRAHNIRATSPTAASKAQRKQHIAGRSEVKVRFVEPCPVKTSPSLYRRGW